MSARAGGRREGMNKGSRRADISDPHGEEKKEGKGEEGLSGGSEDSTTDLSARIVAGSWRGGREGERIMAPTNTARSSQDALLRLWEKEK